MEKVRFAVIGCGNVAMRYMIPALLNSVYSDVVVCTDINPDKENIIKTTFGLPFEISIDKVFANYDFDAVYIASPIGIHKDHVLISANHNKHILCEKSLSINSAETIEMVSVCKKNNVALFEGFMYQFHAHHQFVKQLIDKGEIGSPVYVQAYFGFPPLNPNDFRYNKKLGGGAILDAGAYTVHFARNFFGSEPKKIYSVIESEGHEVEIRGSVLLNFGNNRTASLAFGFNNMYQNRYAIWGTKGIVTLDRAFSTSPEHQSVCTLEQQGNTRNFTMEGCNHFLEEINYFVKNYKNQEIVNKWYSEAINQSNVLESLKM